MVSIPSLLRLNQIPSLLHYACISFLFVLCSRLLRHNCLLLRLFSGNRIAVSSFFLKKTNRVSSGLPFKKTQEDIQHFCSLPLIWSWNPGLINVCPPAYRNIRVLFPFLRVVLHTFKVLNTAHVCCIPKSNILLHVNYTLLFKRLQKYCLSKVMKLIGSTLKTWTHISWVPSANLYTMPPSS